MGEIYGQARMLREMKMYHRDIKAENIIILNGWNFKFIDFGIAKHLRESDPEFGTYNIAGTPGYWGPELEQAYQSQNYSAEYDIWEADKYSIRRTIEKILA